MTSISVNDTSVLLGKECYEIKLAFLTNATVEAGLSDLLKRNPPKWML